MSKKNFEIAFELGAKMDPSMRKTFTDAQKQLGNFGSKMKSVVKTGAKVAAGLGVAFLGVGTAMGTGMVKAAAEAQAMNAQFEQVFGNVGDSAQTAIDKMAKDFGMVSNRIKPAMSTMTSMFKGLGMDTKEAMSTAQNAVTLTADAAAFYDKSFEDANAALNSFIKGNYEGGESIGLFANETQLASWASKNLGEDWKKLDEAGKQVARLEYAKAMQDSAGATGQAARESDSLENQWGNLRQVWQDLQAKLGETVLPIVVDHMKNLASWLQTVDTTPLEEGIKSFSEKFDQGIDKALEFAGIFKNEWLPKIRDSIQIIIEKAKEVYNFISNNWSTIQPVITGIVIGLALFKGVMVTMSIIQTVTAFINGFKTALSLARGAMLFLNSAMLANPAFWIVAAFMAVIAIGIAVWKNWDTVKEYLLIAWEAIKTAVATVGSAISSAFTAAYNWVINLFMGIGAWFMAKFLSIQNGAIIVGQAIGNAFSAAYNWIVGVFAGIGAWFVGIFSSVKNAAASVGRWIGDKFSAAYNAITGLFRGLGGWFSGIMGGVTGSFTTGINAVIGLANKAINSLNGISISIPDWVPGVGGSTYGVSIPNIPYLAEGGITTGATLAMIGEGAEQEAVLPLSKLQALLDMDSGGDTTNNNETNTPYIKYESNIIVEGNADEEELERAMQRERKKFEKWFEEYIHNKKRTKF
ncbi:hypothetical protein [Virgibacillus halodenitrificans]|uniref:hypothetical protein n=1 Tax=Virgibacillus halodenitrificans TaxID=1482 RepID=UPI000EF4AEC6|nr:hypothetical protein [Virgibacillus halodenitrificans]